MLFQVGEIAEKTGLTIRTLHHYEEIGLLLPTARTDAGYRLYNMQCIERLTQIQLLRQVGVKLKDIGELLDGQSGDIASLLQERIALLTEQMEQMATLRYRLEQLHRQMQTGDVLTQADWFSVLEMMSMFDKYFTPRVGTIAIVYSTYAEKPRMATAYSSSKSVNGARCSTAIYRGATNCT